MEKLEANMETRIQQAQKLSAKLDRERLQLTEAIDLKMFEQGRIERRLRYLKSQKEELESCLKYEREKMDMLQQFLEKLRFSDNAYQKKPIKSCLSEQEIKVSQQEDSFGSFWTQLEERLRDSENSWCWHHLKQTWWLHHQIPFSIHKRDSVEDCEGNIIELERRIQRLDVVLRKHGDEAITNNTAKANFYTVSGKAWTSLGAKKALQEQVKHAVNEINELRKSKLAIGRKIGQAEREPVAMERDTEALREKLPEINQRRREACLCHSKLRKQQSEIEKKLARSCL